RFFFRRSGFRRRLIGLRVENRRAAFAAFPFARLLFGVFALGLFVFLRVQRFAKAGLVGVFRFVKGLNIGRDLRRAVSVLVFRGDRRFGLIVRGWVVLIKIIH